MLVSTPIGRMLCEPSWSFESDASRRDNYRLWFIWSGEGELISPDGETIVLAPGMVCVMRSDGIYRASHNPASRLGVTFLNFSYLAPPGTLPPLWCWTPDFLFIDAMTRKIVQLHAAQLAGIADNEMRTSSLLQAVLDELIAAAAQMKSDTPTSRLDRDVIELANKVLEMPAEHDDISGLADHVFRSRSHFTRTFRRIFGVSPTSFVKSTKMLKARDLLQTSSMSIGEICALLGYSTTQYFSRQYKAHFATTPGEDRRRAQGKVTKNVEEDTK